MESGRKREKGNVSRRVTQHNKSRCWWRTAGQMHFTTRSAPTVQFTVGSLPGHPRSPPSLPRLLPLRGLTPGYVQLDARRAPGASGELISVISRSCNLSRLLHGQLIIIAIPISGARFGRFHRGGP